MKVVYLLYRQGQRTVVLCRKMRKGRQEDAALFIIELLDRLNEELNNFAPKNLLPNLLANFIGTISVSLHFPCGLSLLYILV